MEVQSPYNRICISHNREGHRAFAVFLLSFFVGKCRRAVSGVRCRSPPLHLDFYISKIQIGGISGEIRTKKSIYQRKRRLCGTVLYGFLPPQASRQGIYGQAVYPVQGCLLEVVREQYADFYRDRERWRYLQKLDARNSLLSLDGFTDSEGNPLDFIADEAADIAETVVNAVMVDRLKAALPLLSDSEQELIQAIFFDGLSEREVGARLGITQSVVNKRKARILRKLRKIIEN